MKTIVNSVVASLAGAGMVYTGPVWASSFDGRLSVGAGYLWNDTKLQDSKGPAMSVQADAGVRLLGPLAVPPSPGCGT
jgi:hypothetical protein